MFTKDELVTRESMFKWLSVDVKYLLSQLSLSHRVGIDPFIKSTRFLGPECWTRCQFQHIYLSWRNLIFLALYHTRMCS